MTRIRNNKLLNPTDRKIKNLKSDFVISDGPNTSNFINLLDLGIPYDSHYLSRIVLPAGSTDFFLNYGTLKNVTFLLIKVTYNGNYDDTKEDDMDPLYRQEESNYNITYYYEGNSGTTLPIGRLLILNGSYTNKIENIYLNNPLDYDVHLDILHANINDPVKIPTSSAVTISNLYYSDIITNQVPCIVNPATTGSTAFLITEFIPNIPTGLTTYSYEIPYSAITSFQKDILTTIYLYTNTTFYTLKFLTEFDCNQAYSRMLFAYTSYLDGICRYITVDNVFDNGSALSCPAIPITINIM